MTTSMPPKMASLPGISENPNYLNTCIDESLKLTGAGVIPFLNDQTIACCSISKFGLDLKMDSELDKQL